MVYQEANWWQAREDCEKRGMKLLTPTFKQDNDELKDFLNNRIWERGPILDNIYWYLWTSGNDLGVEGQWRWNTTGDPFNYTTWLAGEPNGETVENCMELRMVTYNSILWNDANCYYKKRYICENDDNGLV